MIALLRRAFIGPGTPIITFGLGIFVGWWMTR